MKFTDTMSSFKYMGGSLPMHVTMVYYGYLLNHEPFSFIQINRDCKLSFPKLDIEDV